ncbi:MAG: four helix bundle protein [Gelidibacter sp.]
MSGDINERNSRSKEDSIIAKKSYVFALEIIKTYKFLNEQKEYILSKQILRSGTSIGANVNESIAAVSKKDFVNKLGIALKEARETSYWLNLLKDSNYIEESKFINLNKDCEELVKILNSIILTMNQKYLNNS